MMLMELGLIEVEKFDRAVYQMVLGVSNYLFSFLDVTWVEKLVQMSLNQKHIKEYDRNS